MSFLESLPLPEAHPVRRYLASLSPGSSRETQWSAIQRVARLLGGAGAIPRTLEWHQVTQTQIHALREALIDRYRPATGRRYLSALRGVLEQCWVQELLTADQLQRLIHRRTLAPIRGSSSPPGRALTRGECLALFDACAADRGHLGARDAAILALLIGGGLRRGEVVALDVSDVDLEAGQATVMGKGRKERQLPLPHGTVLALEEWLAVRGAWPGPLIVPLGSGVSKTDANRLSRSGVNGMLRRRAADAKLASVMVHDFRRTYISDLLEAGRGLEVAARLAGHADVNTTAQYDRRTDEKAKAAADDIEVTFRPSGRRLKPLKPTPKRGT